MKSKTVPNYLTMKEYKVQKSPKEPKSRSITQKQDMKDHNFCKACQAQTKWWFHEWVPTHLPPPPIQTSSPNIFHKIQIRVHKRIFVFYYQVQSGTMFFKTKTSLYTMHHVKNVLFYHPQPQQVWNLTTSLNPPLLLSTLHLQVLLINYKVHCPLASPYFMLITCLQR